MDYIFCFDMDLFFPLEYQDKDKDVPYGSSKLNMNQVSAYFVSFVS